MIVFLNVRMYNKYLIRVTVLEWKMEKNIHKTTIVCRIINVISMKINVFLFCKSDKNVE